MKSKINFGVLIFVTALMATVAAATPQSASKINRERLLGHIQKLAEFGKNPQGGVSRVAYSPADQQGRRYVTSLMKEAGLTVTTDAAGNLVGRYDGQNMALRPVVMGSHIDTVPEGGNYDGIVGALSAIEVAQSLRENNIVLRHPLEVIVFQNEETGHLGSRAITSGLSEADMRLKSLSGKTNQDGMRAIGGSPDHLASVLRKNGDIAGYIELHIEQGGVLEKEKKDIGVVTGIVGIRRWNVTVEGFANHAGTTPMAMRQDALWAAAKVIDAVHQLVTTMPGRQVATVGKIEALPGAANVIPGMVHFTIEVRDLSADKIDLLSKTIKAKANLIAKQTSTSITFEQTYNTAPCLTTPSLQRDIATSANALQLSNMPIPSGAGHDAQELAKLGPMGMIFIPSVNGISHSPKEYTAPQDIENGANVLLRTLVQFDANQ